MKTRADFASEAEWYRHHRRVFDHALALRLTPRAAEQDLMRIQAREEHRAAMDRLERMKNGVPAVGPAAGLAPAPAAPARLRDLPDEKWMMRD